MKLISSSALLTKASKLTADNI